MTAPTVDAWVASTRAAQGLSPRITDPATLAELAGMVAETLRTAEDGECLAEPA